MRISAATALVATTLALLSSTPFSGAPTTVSARLTAQERLAVELLNPDNPNYCPACIKKAMSNHFPHACPPDLPEYNDPSRTSPRPNEMRCVCVAFHDLHWMRSDCSRECTFVRDERAMATFDEEEVEAKEEAKEETKEEEEETVEVEEDETKSEQEEVKQEEVKQEEVKAEEPKEEIKTEPKAEDARVEETKSQEVVKPDTHVEESKMAEEANVEEVKEETKEAKEEKENRDEAKEDKENRDEL
ncbi:hypothetical protein BG000_003245 [Podila horticola]|nr:hypothetical protein BG000_003245 [Podila horticola]